MNTCLSKRGHKEYKYYIIINTIVIKRNDLHQQFSFASSHCDNSFEIDS